MVRGCSYTNHDLCCIRTAFSPDGKYFAVRWEKKCRVYITTDQTLYTEIEVDTPLFSIDFSPCGKFLALGSNNLVQVIEFTKTPSSLILNLECCTLDKFIRAVYNPIWVDS